MVGGPVEGPGAGPIARKSWPLVRPLVVGIYLSPARRRDLLPSRRRLRQVRLARGRCGVRPGVPWPAPARRAGALAVRARRPRLALLRVCLAGGDGKSARSPPADRGHGVPPRHRPRLVRPSLSESGHDARGGFGNLIVSPLQKGPRELGNGVFLDDHVLPWVDQWAHLASVGKVGRAQVEAIVRDAEQLGASRACVCRCRTMGVRAAFGLVRQSREGGAQRLRTGRSILLETRC